MGMTPAQLDGMTLWEFDCAWKGYRKFHTVPDEDERPPAMSDDLLSELGIVGFEGEANGRRYQ